MSVLIVGDVRSSHVQKWYEGLGSHGFEPILLSDFRIADRIGDHRRVSRLINAFRYLRLCFQVLAKVWLGRRVCHIHYISRYSLISLLVPRSRLVTFAYGSDVTVAPYRSKLLRSLVKQAITRSSLTIASSHWLAEQVSKLAPDTAVDVVSFGIQREFLVSSAKNPGANGKLRLGCFKYCRVETYGLDLLIDLVEELVYQRNVEVELLLIDSGPDLVKFKALLAERRLCSVVRFIEPDSQQSLIIGYLKDLDFTIYPSRRESFGVSMIESMAVGVPSMTTEIQGMAEIGAKLENHLKFTRDFRTNADILLQCISDKAAYTSLSGSGIDTVRKYYVWEQNLESFVACHTEKISN